MNKWIIGAAAFVGGVIAGSAATYAIIKHKYLLVSLKDMEEDAELVDATEEELEDEDDDLYDDIPEEAYESYASSHAKADIMAYKKMLDDLGYIPEQYASDPDYKRFIDSLEPGDEDYYEYKGYEDTEDGKAYKEFEDSLPDITPEECDSIEEYNLFKNGYPPIFDEEVKDEERDDIPLGEDLALEPHIISESDFGMINGYDQVSLMYWDDDMVSYKDGVLLTGDEIEDLLGRDYSAFSYLAKCDYGESVYVVNHQAECYYELVKMEECWAEVWEDQN